jgi:hypothetical protein
VVLEVADQLFALAKDRHAPAPARGVPDPPARLGAQRIAGQPFSPGGDRRAKGLKSPVVDAVAVARAVNRDVE